jgi:hypothetical protein
MLLNQVDIGLTFLVDFCTGTPGDLAAHHHECVCTGSKNRTTATALQSRIEWKRKNQRKKKKKLFKPAVPSGGVEPHLSPQTPTELVKNCG